MKTLFYIIVYSLDIIDRSVMLTEVLRERQKLSLNIRIVSLLTFQLYQPLTFKPILLVHCIYATLLHLCNTTVYNHSNLYMRQSVINYF